MHKKNNSKNSVRFAAYEKNAGGGEAGEKAVMARREYLDGHDLFMKRELKELAKLKYLPRNEKDYINHDTVEDYYD